MTRLPEERAGGGGLVVISSKNDGGPRRKIRIKHLKETNLGVGLNVFLPFTQRVTPKQGGKRPRH